MEEDDISVLIDTVSSLCEAAKCSGWEEKNYRQWKAEEAEIWRDIEPIAHLAKEIIHSNRSLYSIMSSAFICLSSLLLL